MGVSTCPDKPSTSPTRQGSDGRPVRRFTVLCGGYIASMTGTALTAFALTVWIYLETGSTIQFAIGFILSLLPAIALSPFAGALVDRWNRRTVMLASDMVGVCTSLSLAVLSGLGVLQPWHIFITITVRSALGAFLVPALNASVTQLAPRNQLGRANGMVMTATAVSQTVAPARRAAHRRDRSARDPHHRLSDVLAEHRHSSADPHSPARCAGAQAGRHFRGDPRGLAPPHHQAWSGPAALLLCRSESGGRLRRRSLHAAGDRDGFGDGARCSAVGGWGRHVPRRCHHGRVGWAAEADPRHRGAGRAARFLPLSGCPASEHRPGRHRGLRLPVLHDDHRRHQPECSADRGGARDARPRLRHLQHDHQHGAVRGLHARRSRFRADLRTVAASGRCPGRHGRQGDRRRYRSRLGLPHPAARGGRPDRRAARLPLTRSVRAARRRTADRTGSRGRGTEAADGRRGLPLGP